jgi:hypothetical protein
MKVVGDVLADLREQIAAGVPKRQIARNLGVAPKTIRYWASGRSPKRTQTFYEREAARMLSGGQRSGRPRAELLTISWIVPKLRAGVCEETGIKFNYRNPLLRPSLDRVIPGDKRGEYSPENTRVVIRAYNMMKNRHSREDTWEVIKLLQGA